MNLHLKPEGFKKYHWMFSIAVNNPIEKCFNTTGFENMENPVYHGKRYRYVHSRR